MTETDPAATERIRELIRALTRAYDEVVTAIDTIADTQEAYEHAGALREEVERLAKAAADLRSQIVYRIYKTEELSLAGLAQRINVSRARVHQHVKAAEAAEAAESTQED